MSYLFGLHFSLFEQQGKPSKKRLKLMIAMLTIHQFSPEMTVFLLFNDQALLSHKVLVMVLGPTQAKEYSLSDFKGSMV